MTMLSGPQAESMPAFTIEMTTCNVTTHSKNLKIPPSSAAPKQLLFAVIPLHEGDIARMFQCYVTMAKG